ncbi:MAG: hypothetical protein QXF01_00545 [Candidatus Micrarchaeaceae archaeon]
MSITRINIGPVHPSTHGVLHLMVDVEGDTVKNVEPHIGFLHRGVEKLAETRMYMQSPPYMEKLDYVAPLAYDEAYVATVESALGIEVKERAQYIRLIELELQRIASHLFFLGALCNDMGQMFTMFMWVFEDRDRVLDLLQEATGQRMFYVNMRLGGVTLDLPPDFTDNCLNFLQYLEKRISKYENYLEKNPVFIERTKGVGILDKSEAKSLGVTGPILRASGIPYDVRKQKPYYVYEKLNFSPAIQQKGDNFARYKIRIMELYESIRLVREALRRMPEGNALGLPVKLIGPQAKNKVVTVSRELPRGECMMYMVADSQRPYRLAIRSPCFINLHALNYLAKGQRLADLFSIMGTLDLVMACVDR